MSDEEQARPEEDDVEPEEEDVEEKEFYEPTWPVKGPATPRQAMVAIGFIFFLGLVIGFVLARTF